MNPGLWTWEGSWHRENHKIPLPYPSPSPAVGRGSLVSESQRHLTRWHVLSHMLFWLYVLPIELDFPLVDIGVSLHFLTICCLGGRKVLWVPEEKQPRLDVLHRRLRSRVTDDGLPGRPPQPHCTQGLPAPNLSLGPESFLLWTLVVSFSLKKKEILTRDT